MAVKLVTSSSLSNVLLLGVFGNKMSDLNVVVVSTVLPKDLETIFIRDKVSIYMPIDWLQDLITNTCHTSSGRQT